ncbi:MAG TPA: peptidoglycan-binding protein [Propionicimonas sp.]|jgi:hypothetical protein
MSLEENADFYTKVGAQLTSWGWDDFINWWPGWATRTNKGSIRMPSGVTVHHTAGAATATSYLINPTDRPELIVLANIHIDVIERRIRFICAGGASHGGYTHEACYDRVIAGTAPLDRDLVPGADEKPFSINKRTVGIEVDGAGGPDEWDDWAYRAAVATSAACQVAAGWPVGDAPRVGAHKEHTTRKPRDPEAPMGTFRKDVLDCIANPWGPNTGRPDFVLGDRVLSRNGNDKGPDVADLIGLLKALGFSLAPGDEFGPAVEGAVMEFQGTHGLTPDGIVRLDTVEAIRRALTLPASTDVETPPPVVGQGRAEAPRAQPVVRERKFRFGQANLEAERFGGIDDDSPRRGEFLRDKLDCSIYALSEVSEKARNAIRAVLGEDRFKVFAVGFVAVLWDSEKWQHAGRKSVDFGTPFHGAIRVTLEDLRGSGLTMDVISMHVRPKVIAALPGQQSDIKKAMNALRRTGVPTLVAGDFNTGTAFDIIEPFGFVRSTRSINTVNDPGIQRLDAVFFTPDVQLRAATQVDPGSVSDHKVWQVKGTLVEA